MKTWFTRRHGDTESFQHAKSQRREAVVHAAKPPSNPILMQAARLIQLRMPAAQNDIFASLRLRVMKIYALLASLHLRVSAPQREPA